MRISIGTVDGKHFNADLEEDRAEAMVRVIKSREAEWLIFDMAGTETDYSCNVSIWIPNITYVIKVDMKDEDVLE